MTKVGKRIIVILAAICIALVAMFVVMTITTKADETESVSENEEIMVIAPNPNADESADIAVAPVADENLDIAPAKETTSDGNALSSKAIAAGIAIGLAALGGAFAMGIAISKSSESIARQPEAEGKIRTTLMLGLVFIETAIIYALVVAILIIFVL